MNDAPPPPPPPMSAPPPPTPPLPPSTGYLGGSPGGSVGGVSRTYGAPGAATGGASEGNVSINASSAYHAAVQAVRQARGIEKYAQPPASLSFEIIKKEFFATGGLSIRYAGVVQIAPLNALSSSVRVLVKPVPGTLTPLLFIGAITSLIMMFIWYAALGLGTFGLLLGLVVSAAQFYMLAKSAPGEMAEAILHSVSSARALPMPPQAPSPVSPSVASVPVAPVPVAPDTAQAEQVASHPVATPIAEQIVQLAALRDTGALTADEFERAKAAMLARL
jgi:hypothetical protein